MQPAENVDFNQISPVVLEEAIANYLKKHPEVMERALLSSGFLDKLATKEDLRLLIEMMDKRFEAVDKRFEAMEKRFELIDQRFELIDQRFEAVDKRFEVVDKRFDSLEKRLAFMQWFMGFGFAFLSILIVLIKFLTVAPHP